MHQDLPTLLTAIWERLATLTDHVMDSRTETSERLSSIERQLLNGHHRMNDLERRQRSKAHGTFTGFKAFLKDMAALKEWAAVTALIILALKGILQPEDVKQMLLSIIGAGSP